MLSLYFDYGKVAALKPLFLTAAVLIGLNACTPALVEKLPYYKLDVIQGVPFDAQSVLSIQAGMNRQQVAMELGTPLLRPALRDDRWNYVYEIARGGKIKEQRSLTVFFNGDIVSKVEGNALDYAREQLPNFTPAEMVLQPIVQAASMPMAQ
ncbi:outer membrane protein assembly factor BamE [Wielerella bovis]|uniref:outer membrane protein assembly factor BamE n=1 Tax=Wielerella bovis TaxID=2917790 RepID=UPI002019D1A9|nr:outer membrane protein assembly factor BamE [Wielerella bovis]ULJ64465.1 outer membrane protein assembly factor BamE [Wielerella bovis]ULJ66743.1 outer membrane protein assembly factor BamE [Wielerella bovis]